MYVTKASRAEDRRGSTLRHKIAIVPRAIREITDQEAVKNDLYFLGSGPGRVVILFVRKCRGIPCFIVLCYIELCRYCVFINIKARPSNSKKMRTH